MMSLSGFENYNIGGMWYQDEQDQYILGVFIHNYNDTSESEFDKSSPEAKKMIEAVSKAFGIDVPQTADDGENNVARETETMAEATIDQL